MGLLWNSYTMASLVVMADACLFSKETVWELIRGGSIYQK